MELNEEEKKAIETIEFLKKKKWYKYGGDSGTEILDEDEKKDIDIILNLIDEQQKEIEKLKFSNHMVSKWNEHLDKECISKNKIREKIEKYEKNYIRQDKEELFNLTKITAGALSALQELLEEN